REEADSSRGNSLGSAGKGSAAVSMGLHRAASPREEEEEEEEGRLVKRTGLLTLLSGGSEAASVPSQPHQRVGNADRTEEEWKQALCRDSEKATAAAAVVLFVGACLDLLSQSPGINDSDWARSKQILYILATVAEAGSSERSHLLLVGTLGSLLSMCLGDDSPFPELVRSPRPRRRVSDGDVDLSYPVSPRRSYRSLFPSASPVSDVVDEEARGEERGGGG
ncbi:unnamed protein product, partial [Laminaria digitata]